MTKTNAVVSVPQEPRRPTREECWDRFELVLRDVILPELEASGQYSAEVPAQGDV